MFITGCVYFSIPFIRSPALLGPLLALIGMLHAMYFTVWFPFVASVGHAAPGQALAGTQLLFNISSLLVIFAGAPFLKENEFGKLLFACGFCIVVSAVSFFLLSAKLSEGTVRVVSIWRLKRSDFRALLRAPFLWLLFAGALFEPFGFHTANQLFPNLARECHAVHENSIAIIVSFSRIPALFLLLLLARYIDRLNAHRVYGCGLFLGGAGVLCLGSAPNTIILIAAFTLYYIGQGIVWGSNSTAVNRAVSQQYKDAAFACMGLVLTTAILLVGLVHHLLVAAGVSLPRVFLICGTFGILSGTTLILRCRGKDFNPSK